MQRTPADDDPLSAELFERSSEVAELDGPQVEAWVSGLFAAWDADEAAVRFVDYCRASPGPVAALLCAAVAELGGGVVAAAASDAASALGEYMPAGGAAIGTSEAVAAWQVSARFGHSVVIAFGPQGSVVLDADHSMLAEIGSGGAIEDLRLAGSPAGLLPDDGAADESPQRSKLVVQQIGVKDAADAIHRAWLIAAGEPQTFEESVAANERFVGHRIETILDVELPPLRLTEPELDPHRGMSDDEFAEADRAARSTLRAALGDIEHPEALSEEHNAWIAVIRGVVEGSSLQEAEALLYLEWADWLGAGIGLVRQGAGAIVDGSALVDLVNRCPEVSSTIAAADREYTAGAFDVAIEHLAECGVVVDGQLTPVGHATLPASMLAAWSPPFSRESVPGRGH